MSKIRFPTPVTLSLSKGCFLFLRGSREEKQGFDKLSLSGIL